jgi:hypothetical protein
VTFEAMAFPTAERVLIAYPEPVRRKADHETGSPSLDP